MKKIVLMCFLAIASIATSFGQNHVASAEPAVKAKELQKQLKLSESQTVKIKGIYEESARKYEKIKTQEHGDTNKMLIAIRPLRNATISKIKAVLKPKQVVEYDELLKNKKGNDGNGWGDGWSATSN